MKDKDLWKKYTENIKPLHKEPNETSQPPSPEIRLKKRKTEKAIFIPDEKNSQKAFDPLKPADIDKKNFERLRKGKMSIEATLDLHGYTHKEAYALIHQKLHLWHNQGKRCVLVITGKGLRSENPKDSLKHLFPAWINQGDLRALLLAYTPAQPKDGGSGAFYVLLKAKKKDVF